MKKQINHLSVAVILLSLTAFASCGNNETAESKTADTTNIYKHNTETSKYMNIVFASKIDTTCGMPVSAGVSDTLMLDGKVYGFCAPECKAEFEKTLKLQAKR